jgi:hypothetical protein
VVLGHVLFQWAASVVAPVALAGLYSFSLLYAIFHKEFGMYILFFSD